jgi:hypothetical protein
MLADAAQHLRAVAASDDRFAHLEDIQVQHQEGPCIEAFDTKELVGAIDLEREGRWPLFSEARREPAARVTSPLVPASSRKAFGRRLLTAVGHSPDSSAGQENSMIILGLMRARAWRPTGGRARPRR